MNKLRRLVERFKFNSRSPIIALNKIRTYSDHSDHQSFSTVRLSSRNVHKLGGRNAYVRIQSKTGSICRQIQGIGNHALECHLSGDEISSKQGFTSEAIEMDYDSRLDLGLVVESEKLEYSFFACTITISPASVRDIFFLHWKHPNLAYRTPFQISIVSLFLGISGLILGAIGLITS